MWDTVGEHEKALRADGALDRLRAGQARAWMWSEVHDELADRLRRHEAVRAELPRIEAQVGAGTLSPAAAARLLLEAFTSR